MAISHSYPAQPDHRPPPGDGRDIVFDARGLTKAYVMGEVTIHALRGVDMTPYAGELAVLLDGSGSGKSTLRAAHGSRGGVRHAGQHGAIR